jgi:hypothetical protein
MTGFAYTDEQWDAIKDVVRGRLGHDADEIELTRPAGKLMQMVGTLTTITSLRSAIETAASLHITESALASQTLAHRARIKKLEALRVRADALHADLLDVVRPSFTVDDDEVRRVILGGDLRAKYGLNVDPFDEAGRAFATVMDVIDASIAVCRPQETANTSKSGRDRFWDELVVIWTGIGGAETGIAAAEFVVATSETVFNRVLAIGGDKTMASMPQDIEAVKRWLRLRRAARR